MPDDGWSEPWPRQEHDDLGAWEQFVASIDVDDLRREHMRVLGDLTDERFGSRQHHETMHAHEYMAEQLRWDRAELDAMIAKTGLSPERAALLVVTARYENRNNHHTRGTAA